MSFLFISFFCTILESRTNLRNSQTWGLRKILKNPMKFLKKKQFPNPREFFYKYFPTVFWSKQEIFQQWGSLFSNGKYYEAKNMGSFFIENFWDIWDWGFFIEKKISRPQGSVFFIQKKISKPQESDFFFLIKKILRPQGSGFFVEKFRDPKVRQFFL